MLFKVGDVAKKIGLSVRALHHYDEIGLLSPTHRSDAGYRLYSFEDLMQLQKIKSLQQLDFSLDEIHKLLNQSETSLLTVIEKHMQKLTQEAEQQQRLIERLQQLANQLACSKQPSVELLFDSLKETIMYEKYYSSEQLEQLAKRKKQLGDDVLNAAQQEWKEIFEKFQKLYQGGKSSSCPEAQVLAKRSLELIDQFTGGDPGIGQSLQKMIDTEGGDRLFSQGGMNIDKAFFAYYSEALEFAKKK